jgi:hypothetical protein
VVKFKSKDFQIATEIRRPDRRPNRQVAFAIDSTGRGPAAETTSRGRSAPHRVKRISRANSSISGLRISLRETKSSPRGDSEQRQRVATFVATADLF